MKGEQSDIFTGEYIEKQKLREFFLKEEADEAIWQYSITGEGGRYNDSPIAYVKFIKKDMSFVNTENGEVISMEDFLKIPNTTRMFNMNNKSEAA